MHYDVYLVGVGGQGLLTIGKVLAETALRLDVAVNFYPTKGMAQRGGAVRAQLRLGRPDAAPTIPEAGAHLVIATELSEALKGVRFARPGGEFLLYGHVWEPTEVMLGRAHYPKVDAVLETLRRAGARPRYLDPADRPSYEGRAVPANLFVLGAAVGHTALGERFSLDEVALTVRRRWPGEPEGANLAALEAGAAASVEVAA
jgi:indolepyruvate ferredoxin oxidoreductase beta subunit